jgi:hypothetical protein
LTDHLPDPEISPDDLIRFADNRLHAVQDAIARGDSAAAIGHLNDLAAEGNRELVDRFNSGLVETGLRNLAKAAEFEDEDDEARRVSFIGLAAVRPLGGPEPRRWSAGQERLYLVRRAGVFHAYIDTRRFTDPTEAVMYRKAADLTAHELIAWDALYDTRLGPYTADDAEFGGDPHAYVVQEMLASESF